jgi:hypothetical protein
MMANMSTKKQHVEKYKVGSKQQNACENYILFLRPSFANAMEHLLISNEFPNLVRNRGWLRHQTKYCRSVSKIDWRL